MAIRSSQKISLLAKKIQLNLSGKSARQVTVRANLTGPAAEAWLDLRSSGEPLGLDDQGLLTALLDAGAASLRRALREIER